MKRFKTQKGVARVEMMLDTIARAAWEPFHNNEEGYSSNENARVPVCDAYGNLIPDFPHALDRAIGVVRSQIAWAGERLPRARALLGDAPTGFEPADPSSNWAQFEYRQILDIIASDHVVSVADATIKASAYLGTTASAFPTSQGRFLFRGQSDISHTLRPRLGRRLHQEIGTGKAPPDDPSQITADEVAELRRFQSNWPPDHVDPLDLHVSESLDLADAGWWSLMQHYDDGDGTRLLDVTSSLLFALLFACVRWSDGTIDRNRDGVVYLFGESGNLIVDDYLVKKAPTSHLLFSENYLDIAHMVFNPPHNERSKAQGGAFIWWPRFWDPLPGPAPAFLRVPGEYKKQIARELLSFGVGPKEAVRGKRGLEIERALRSAVGLPSWEPYGLT